MFLFVNVKFTSQKDEWARAAAFDAFWNPGIKVRQILAKREFVKRHGVAFVDNFMETNARIKVWTGNQFKRNSGTFVSSVGDICFNPYTPPFFRTWEDEVRCCVSCVFVGV